MDFENKNILFVGAGNMGQAILRRLISEFENINFAIVDPNVLNTKFGDRVQIYKDINDYKAQPDYIFLCVKPQIIEQVIADYKQFKDAIFISIIAGKKIEFFQKHLGQDAKIVRTMPNLAVAFDEGLIMYSHINLSPQEKRSAEIIISTLGMSMKASNEEQFDSFTAIAGSGPAYFFAFMDNIFTKAQSLGYNEKQAKTLAYQTAFGASKYAKLMSAQNSFEDMKKSVTSPGGTTQAALEVLEKDGTIAALVEEAIDAAIKRSKELSD